MKVHIIYPVSDNPDGIERPLGMTKKQVIGCCFSSLLKSVETLGGALHVTVVSKGLSEEAETFIREQLANISASYVDGNQTSIYDVANANNEPNASEWLYFCQDDYLHDYNNFLPRFLDFVAFVQNKKFARPVFFSPSDELANYSTHISRTFVFQSLTGYIREVSYCSGNFLCPRNAYREFAEHIKLSDGDGAKLSSVFKKAAFCFSVLPSIATHCKQGATSSFVDWESIIYGR